MAQWTMGLGVGALGSPAASGSGLGTRAMGPPRQRQCLDPRSLALIRERLRKMEHVKARAWLGLLSLAGIMGAVLFVAAGSVRYWQAWAYLGVFFAGATLITLYLVINNPTLLARRLRAGPSAEKEPRQKIIMAFTSIGFVAMLVVPAVDQRFTWSRVPLALAVLGDLLTVLGYVIIFRVFRENPFTSATVEVAPEQKVIESGPYAIVRHPMYAGGALLLVGMPPALASYWGFLPLAAMLPFLLWRLMDEERFLAQHLPGYAEYCTRVRWRMIPKLF
jgi:protein-S-isoprenylcysteine O-methyltransferase Ste14